MPDEPTFTTRGSTWREPVFRVVLPTILCLVLFCAAVFAFILPAFEEGSLTRKREMIRELTRTVCQVLAGYEAQVQSGTLARDAAQALAVEEVRSLRYGDEGKDYFWINDRQPRMILHPYLPELEGQDLSEYADPDGTHLFVEMVRVVREQGAGYVRYRWQRRDDPASVAPKLSYVQEFAPWGWIVGTGVYLDDVARETQALTRRMLTVTAGVLVIVAILSALVIWQGFVTERRRRRAESALRASEAEYRQLVESMNDGLVVQDERGRFVFVNDRFCEILGRQRFDVLGREVTEFLGTRAREDREARAQTGSGSVEPYELMWQRPDGSEIATIVAPQALRDARGARNGSFAVVTDISARREAERALRRSERRLAMLMSNLPGMAYRCRNDPKWTMEFVSEGCRALTGYGPSDLQDSRVKAYADLVHADDREQVWQEVQAALAEQRAFRLTYRIVTRGGDERWVWEQGQGILDNNGQLEALEGFITDITDRKRAEEAQEQLERQLRQAQKMEAIGQLAGGVAHDFNNILTAILGNVELALVELRRRFPDEAPLLEEMHQIERSAHRASALTRQLLAFSRRQVAQPEVIDLNRTLRDLEKMLRRLLTEDIVLELDTAPDLRPVCLDPGQLEQVIVNLVINARDAMPAGGHLTVSTTNVQLGAGEAAVSADGRSGPGILLAVRDTGTGMDTETLERIFEPFYTTKPPGKGTGLGLATVYGIVKQAGGHVAVASWPQGGTTFRVFLPAVEAEPTSAPPAGAEDPPLDGNETVLVCEDDDTVRDLIARMLSEAGYRVLTAADGPDALRIAREHDGDIDLLITDVIMPDMDGRALADALATERPAIRTLFVSGYTADVIAPHGVVDEDVQLLEKPFRRRTLLQRVRRLLD